MAGTAEVDRMVVRLVGDTGQYVQSMKGAAKATQKFTRDASGRLHDMQGRYLRGSKLMRAELSLANGAFKKAAVILRHYGMQLRAAGTRMRALGRSMMLRMTLPLALFGAMAVKAFAGFDSAMTESTSIMKVTQEQVERMRQTALTLSGDSAKSAKNLGEAYFFLASAGKDAEQSISLLPKVMDFAIAGAFDMATATDLLTDAQSALGLTSKNVATDTENMVRVSDVLVKANTLANASVQQFSIALTSKAGSSLKAFSKDVEEGVAVLAAFADQGVKAQLAGNQLDRVIRLLSKASMDNAKQHKQLGFEVFDAQGKMRNMGDIVGNLEDILEGMSDQTKVATLDMLGFEARVQQAILPLLGTSEAIKRYEKELRKAGGTTKMVADKQMKSFSNQMKVMWNRVTNFAIAVGEILSPILLKLNDYIGEALAVWNSWSPAVKKTIVYIGLAAAAIGPLLIALGGVATALGFAAAGIAAVLPLIGSFIGIVGTVAAAIVSPIGLVVTAIAGVSVAVLHHFGIIDKAIDWLGKQWGKVVKEVKLMMKGIKGALKAGEIKLAMKILWAQLHLAWVQGIRPLREAWVGFVFTYKSVMIEAMHFVWSNWRTTVNMIAEVMIKIQLVARQITVKQAKDQITELKKMTKEALAAVGKSRQQMLDDARAAAGKSMKEIRADIDRLKKGRDKAVTEGVVAGLAVDLRRMFTSELSWLQKQWGTVSSFLGKDLPVPEVTDEVTVPIKFKVIKTVKFGTSEFFNLFPNRPGGDLGGGGKPPTVSPPMQIDVNDPLTKAAGNILHGASTAVAGGITSGTRWLTQQAVGLARGVQAEAQVGKQENRQEDLDAAVNQGGMAEALNSLVALAQEHWTGPTINLEPANIS